MQLAFVIAMLIIVLFVVMSDFSTINLDESTERLLYVSDADSMGYEYEETTQEDSVNTINQTVDNVQQSDFSDFSAVDDGFAEYDFDNDFDLMNDTIAESAGDLLDKIYNK